MYHLFNEKEIISFTVHNTEFEYRGCSGRPEMALILPSGLARVSGGQEGRKYIRYVLQISTPPDTRL